MAEKKAAQPQILHQDRDIIVLHKPSGFTVYREDASISDAKSWVERKCGGTVFPVHRIDRGTCGILLFARTPKAADALKLDFLKRRVRKSYLVIVVGLTPASGSVDRPLKDRDGKALPAVTRYSRLRTWTWGERTLSFLRVDPKSGRLHQIRRHLDGIGFPILGDEKYGDAGANRDAQKRWGVKRTLLSAEEISFQHPGTFRPVTFRTKPDADFERVLRSSERPAAAGAPDLPLSPEGDEP